MGKEQLLLRAGDAHIAQPPFLFQVGRAFHRARDGKQAIFQTRDEDYGELQSFGVVQGHQGDAFNGFVPAVNIGYQGHFFKKFDQAGDRLTLFGPFGRLFKRGHQLVYVLDTGLGLHVSCGLQFQFTEVAGLLEQAPCRFGARYLIQPRPEA